MIVIPQGGQDPQGKPQPASVPAAPVYDQRARMQQPQDDDGYDVRARLTASREIDQREEADTLSTFKVAVQSDPDLHAEAQRIADRLGNIAPGTVATDLSVMRQMVKVRDFESRQLQAHAPKLARSMQDLEFARIAHDQSDRLTIGEQVTENWRAGQLEMERGQIFHRRGEGTALAGDAERLAAIEPELDRLAKQTGFLTGSARVLGQVYSMVPRALTAGMATGLSAAAPVAVATAAGPQVAALPFTTGGAFAAGFGAGVTGSFAQQFYEVGAGSMFEQLDRAGITGERARWAARGFGVLSAGLNTAGGALMTAPMRSVILSRAAEKVAAAMAGETLTKAGVRAAVGYVKAVGGETITEGTEGFASVVFEEVARNGAGILREGFDLRAAAEQFADGAVMAAQAMALLGVPGPVMQFRRDVQNMRAAKRDGAVLSTVAQQLQDVAKRNPEKAKQFADGLLPDQNVYIDAKAMVDALFQTDKEAEGPPKKQSAEQLPEGIAQRVADAAERGDDVVFTFGEYTTLLATNPNLDSKLTPLARLGDPEKATAAEIGTQDVEAMADEAVKAADEQALTAKQWNDEAKQVEDETFQSLMATGLYKRQGDARKNAKTWRLFVETLADDRLGSTPAKVAKDIGLAIQAGEIGPDGMQQDTTRGGLIMRDGRPLIVLTKDTNASTFQHELGHAMLEVYAKLAFEKAHPTIVDDFNAFLKWVGVKDVATWNGMSVDEKRAGHEKFAREFERKLWNGEAPSAGLAKLFTALRKLMRRVYLAWQDITGEVAPREVRDMMDRMLASEKEVAIANEVRGVMPLYSTQEDAGMDDAAWADYQARVKAGDEAAMAALQSASLRDAHYFGRQMAGMDKKLRSEAEKLRKAATPSVAAEVGMRPVYRAIRWFKTGEFTNEDGTKESFKDKGGQRLNTDVVRAYFGMQEAELDRRIAADPVPTLNYTAAEQEAAIAEGVASAEEEIARRAAFQAAKPERLFSRLRGMLSKDGGHPDEAAKVFGFKSGEDLVRAILEAPPIDEAIAAALDQKMANEHAELVDPAKRRETIEKALHNEVRLRAVATELGALDKSGRPSRVHVAAAKESARRALERKRVRELSPQALSMAARRASVETMQLVKEGKTLEAFRAKRNQLVLQNMADMAAGVGEELREAKRLFATIGKPDATLAKRHDMDLINAARELAAKYGAGTKAVTTQEIRQRNDGLAKLAEVDAVLSQTVAGLLGEGGSGGLPWMDLSLGKFRELVEAVQALKGLAADEHDVMVGQARIAAREAVDQLGGAIPPAGGGPTAGQGASPPPWRRNLLSVWDWVSGLKVMEATAHYLDQNKLGGAFFRYLVKPIMQVADAYRTERVGMLEKLAGIVKKAQEEAGELWHADIYSKELDYTFRGVKEILHGILHTGTDSGLRKWLRGKKRADGKTPFGTVTIVDGEEVVDSRDWDAFIAKMWDEGKLSKAHAKTLTDIWTMFDALLPRTQDVHKKRFRREFVELEHRVIRTPHGDLAGGYVPARVDGDMADQKRFDGMDEWTRAHHEAQYAAGTQKGFTEERNPNYNQPLDMNLARLATHLDEELRFIHFELPVSQVSKLLRTKGSDGVTLQDKLDAYDRSLVQQVIKPWLANTAIQATSKRGSRLSELVARVVERATSVAQLGWNLSNALLQTTGLANAKTGIKGSHWRRAAWKVASSPINAVKEAVASSEFLRNRMDETARLFGEDLSRATLKPLMASVDKSYDTWARWAFFPQRALQARVDVVTWLAAHAQAQAEGASHEDAVAIADGAVRRIQGSATPESTASLMASATPMVRLWFQFGRYSNTLLNTILGAYGMRARAEAFLWALVVPSLLEGSLKQMLRPEDDDEPWAENWAEAMGISLVRNVAGTIPVAGPFALTAVQSEGTRVLSAPAASALLDGYRGIDAMFDALVDREGERTTELSDSQWRSVATFWSMATGIPLAGPTRLALDLTR